MNRRSFLKRVFAAAGAVAVGPVAIKVAAELYPSPADPRIITASVLDRITRDLMEKSASQIPMYDCYVSSEVAQDLMGQTAKYWNSLMLKNLSDGWAELAVRPYKT